jgi:hypothetical protein
MKHMFQRTTVAALLLSLALWASVGLRAVVSSQGGAAAQPAGPGAQAAVARSGSAADRAGATPERPTTLDRGPVGVPATLPETGQSTARLGMPASQGTEAGTAAVSTPGGSTAGARAPEADAELLERARGALRRFSTRSVEVTDGVVLVRTGTVTPAEHEDVLAAVRAIAGARGVIIRFTGMAG